MSRLKAGIAKLEASKKGLSDAYVKDEYGIWVTNPHAGVKATGLAPLDKPARELLEREEMAKILKRLEKVAHEAGSTSAAIGEVGFDMSSVLKRGMELAGVGAGSASSPYVIAKELAEKYKEKNEAMKDLGISTDKKIIMTLNQPSKLTVLYSDGAYRTVPFIGGEVFVGKETKVTESGKHVLVAKPDISVNDSKHGYIVHIEVGMDKVKVLFDSKYEGGEEMAVDFDAGAKEALRESQAEKRKAAFEAKKAAEAIALAEKQLKEDAHKKRMETNPEVGSW